MSLGPASIGPNRSKTSLTTLPIRHGLRTLVLITPPIRHDPRTLSLARRSIRLTPSPL
jgi:hypothetical protein